MSYIASDVNTMAQRILVDIDDDAYSDNLLSYLNEGQRRFAAETHCCQAIVDIDGTTSNVLPYSTILAEITGASEVLYVAKVRLDGTTVIYLPKAVMNEMKDLPATSVTNPTRYSLFADTIIFDLNPAAVLDFDTTIFCSYVPSDLAVSDTILIPDQWISAIVQYIVYCCRIADRDAGLANGAWSDYEAIRAQAAAFYVAQSG